MKNFLLSSRLRIFCFVMVCVIAFDRARGSSEPDLQSREKRTVSRNRQGPTRSQLTDVLRRLSGDGDLSQYTPTTPRPEDVNCHVEIPMTTLVGGRCVNLGSESSSNMVCQAGAYLAFTSDCNNGGNGGTTGTGTRRGTRQTSSRRRSAHSQTLMRNRRLRSGGN